MLGTALPVAWTKDIGDARTSKGKRKVKGVLALRVEMYHMPSTLLL